VCRLSRGVHPRQVGFGEFSLEAEDEKRLDPPWWRDGVSEYRIAEKRDATVQNVMTDRKEAVARPISGASSSDAGGGGGGPLKGAKIVL
jgi:hypothetical protein